MSEHTRDSLSKSSLSGEGSSKDKHVTDNLANGIQSVNNVNHIESKQQAQARANQIQAFNLELQQLHIDNVLTLSNEQSLQIKDYHSTLLASLSGAFDVDTNNTEKQLSHGLKIAAFFVALGMAASVFFMFYQFWGHFSPLAQSIVLLASPLLMLLSCWILLKKDASGYYAKIAGFLSLVCFILNLSMLGEIYNITPSPDAFLIWSLMSLGLAYLTRSRLLLASAIMLFAGFLSARIGVWFGLYWMSFGERPETFFIPAVIVFSLGHLSVKHYENFAAVYRIFGALLLLLPILVLSHWARGSYINLDREVIEGIYQVMGFALSAALIALGVRRNWNDAINTGTVFFTLFLYTKMFDWFWEWFPKYLFFLVIALMSLLMLMVFKRIRGTSKLIQKQRNKAQPDEIQREATNG